MKLRELFPRVARAVRAHTPDAPDNMLLDDMARAASRLLADSKLMTRTMVIDLQQSVPDYLLDECPGEGLQWHEIAFTEVNGCPYTPSPIFPVTACSGPGGHRLHWDREAHTITLTPAPNQDTPGGLTLTMVVTTDKTVAAELPDFLADDHDFQDALVAGAAATALEDLAPVHGDRHRTRYHGLLTKLVARRMQGWAGGTFEAMRMTARNYMAR